MPNRPPCNPNSSFSTAMKMALESLSEDAHYYGQQIADLALNGDIEEARCNLDEIEIVRNIRASLSAVETYYFDHRSTSPDPLAGNGIGEVPLTLPKVPEAKEAMVSRIASVIDTAPPVPPTIQSKPDKPASVPQEELALVDEDKEPVPTLSPEVEPAPQHRGPASPMLRADGSLLRDSFTFPVLHTIYKHGALSRSTLKRWMEQDYPEFAREMFGSLSAPGNIKMHLIRANLLLPNLKKWALTTQGKHYVQGK